MKDVHRLVGNIIAKFPPTYTVYHIGLHSRYTESHILIRQLPIATSALWKEYIYSPSN
jgi:hypothetical protein